MGHDEQSCLYAVVLARSCASRLVTVVESFYWTNEIAQGKDAVALSVAVAVAAAAPTAAVAAAGATSGIICQRRAAERLLD